MTGRTLSLHFLSLKQCILWVRMRSCLLVSIFLFSQILIKSWLYFLFLRSAKCLYGRISGPKFKPGAANGTVSADLLSLDWGRDWTEFSCADSDWAGLLVINIWQIENSRFCIKSLHTTLNMLSYWKLYSNEFHLKVKILL